MTEISGRDWANDFKSTLDNPPPDGSILRTLDGSAAKLTVEITEGSAPFIYGRLYVPELVGCQLGWYLQGEDMDTFHGWKCILMPRARADLIQKLGLEGDTVSVQALRLIRPSQSKKSFLCEVEEY